MKFYQGLLPRIIWDPSKNTSLVEFDRNGEFETDDEDLIKLLAGKGYPTYSEMMTLEMTGRLPHGGFEKVDDDTLPSGRPSVEEEGDLHTPKVKTRKRIDLPATEAQELARKKEELKSNIDDLEPPGKTKDKKPKRKITRRKK